MTSKSLRSFCFTLIATSVAVTLLAAKASAYDDDFSDVPEIDPGSIASAAALVVGGVLMLTDRLRRKKAA